MIQEEALKENTAALHVHLPLETATYLLNEKRFEISAIESRVGTPILIVPTSELETPHYNIRRLRSEELESEGQLPSYEVELLEEDEEEVVPRVTPAAAEKAVVGPIAPPIMVTPTQRRPRFAAIRSLFARLFAAKPKPAARPRPPRERPRGQRRGRGRQAGPPRAAPRPAPERTPTPPVRKEPVAAESGEQQQKAEATRGARGRRRGRRGRPQQGKPKGAPPSKAAASAEAADAAKSPLPSDKPTVDADVVLAAPLAAPSASELPPSASVAGEGEAEQAPAPPPERRESEERVEATAPDERPVAPPALPPPTDDGAEELIQVETRRRVDVNEPS